MKTVLKFTVTMALMFITVVGMARDSKLSVVVEKTQKSLFFELEGQSSGTVIHFMDANKNSIYSETISASVNYARKFDLVNLPDGVYVLKADNAQYVYWYTITITGDEVVVSESEESAKPIFKHDGDKVFLNLLNLDKSDVEISVYDSENRLVFTEIMENQMIVEKAFNFEKAYEDVYTLIVKDDLNKYYEDIVVN